MIALDLLQRLNVQPGARILVNGASGGIGPLILQIAKRRYHAVVTGVCSTAKLNMVRALGADAVIDYTREDFASTGQTYDLVIDVLGKSSFAHVKPALSRTGRLVYVSFKEKQLVQMVVSRLVGGPQVICMLLNERQQNLDLARELIEAGVIRAVVDRVYPLSQIADAHRYAEARTRKGAVVLSMAASA
jgi:NADPH:quinone reductase-like Zn-dependent oxidoreductase